MDATVCRVSRETIRAKGCVSRTISMGRYAHERICAVNESAGIICRSAKNSDTAEKAHSRTTQNASALTNRVSNLPAFHGLAVRHAAKWRFTSSADKVMLHSASVSWRIWRAMNSLIGAKVAK